MKNRILVAALLLCVMTAFLVGVLAAKRDIPPVPQLASLVRAWKSGVAPGRIAITADEIENIIAIDSGKKALEKREVLREAISIGALTPDISAGKNLRYARRDLIQSHQAYRFDMPHGLVSNVHYLQPANYNRRIFILHGGHDSWPEDFGADALITALLEKGFGVALFSMPLTGYNRQKISLQTSRFGRIDLTNHNAFFFAETADFSPIGFFVDPVLSFVAHASGQGIADQFAMGGLSGGGWTTVIAAALEPRISKSYVIAGTSPEFLTPHVTPSGWGDYEQTNMLMLRAANYLEMYTLASLESGRKQVHLFARNDPCCWNGPNLEMYEAPVQSRLRKLGGGKFAVAIDEQYAEHSFSRFTNDFIISDLIRP